MADWHIGQKVVCIKRGEPWASVIPPHEIQIGPDYLEKCVIEEIWAAFDRVWFRIERYTKWYQSIWFRPIVEDKTQLDLLQRIARDVQAKEPAMIETDPGF